MASPPWRGGACCYYEIAIQGVTIFTSEEAMRVNVASLAYFLFPISTSQSLFPRGGGEIAIVITASRSFKRKIIQYHWTHRPLFT
jgi:hypothetical protein